MQKQVLHNQSVQDCLLQHTGSLTKLIEFLVTNNLSVTDQLQAGIYYEFPTVDDDVIFNYFNSKGAIPATAISTTDLEATSPELGIGQMTIGSTFIVR